MKISTKGQYAIETLIYISINYKEETVNAKKIAKELNISETYLTQILVKLKQSSILRSTRGSKGGYILEKSIDDISIREVLIAVEKDNKYLTTEDILIDNINKKIDSVISEVTGNITIKNLVDKYNYYNKQIDYNI